MRKYNSFHLFLFSVMFMVFFHLLTTLVEATYAFGLLGVGIPPEIIYVLFLLSPILLLFYPQILRGKTGRGLALLSGLAGLFAWCALPFLGTQGKLLAGGIGTGSMLLFFPAVLQQRPSGPAAVSLGGSLGFGILAGVLLHQLNFGSAGLPAPFNLVFLALVTFSGAIALSIWYSQSPQPVKTSTLPPASFLHTLSACIGFSSVLLLLYFCFSNPGVISRWTENSLALVVGLTTAICAVFLFFFFASGRSHFSIPSALLLAWNGLFALALAGTLLSYQIPFPADASAYPLTEAAPGLDSSVALLLMLLLHPVLYADAALLLSRLANERVSAARLAWGTAIAALYQLVMIVAHIGTTVYDYLPVIGPYLRDRFWLVNAVPGAILVISLLWHWEDLSFEPGETYQRWTSIAAGGLAAAIIGLAVSGIFASNADPGPGVLRVMTYNIQQGYSADGQKNFTGQLETIREREPDILGLQETDMARISGGNSDMVRYLARNLRMHSYYGPKTVNGTFGIALLSRYPIQNPRTFYLYSEGEQTAVIVAEIRARSKLYTIMVTHLGNGGPLVQQQEILSLAAGKKNIILMGDFNFSPTTQQYLQTTALFQDGWLLAGEKKLTPPGQNLERRIDHIFLSPGLSAVSGEFIGKGPSDHPALLLVIPLLE